MLMRPSAPSSACPMPPWLSSRPIVPLFCLSSPSSLTTWDSCFSLALATSLPPSPGFPNSPQSTVDAWGINAPYSWSLQARPHSLRFPNPSQGTTKSYWGSIRYLYYESIHCFEGKLMAVLPFLFLLAGRSVDYLESKLAFPGADNNQLVASFERTLEDHTREHVIHPSLDGAPQRTGAELGIEALLGDQCHGGVGELDPDPLSFQASRRVLEE